MANGETVKRRAALRKSELLDAAASVFAEKGYFGASTKDIADRLGMVQSALYYYFPSKEAALAEVCLFGGEGFNQRLAEITKSRKRASDKVRAATHNHLAPLRDRRDHVLTYLNERHNLPAPTRHQVGRLAREYEAMVEAILRAGVRDGEFRETLDCRMATLVFLAACNSVARSFGKAVEGMSLEEYGDGIADTLLHGFSRPES